MTRKPLGPRSSGAQLWAEVERLRRARGDTRRTVSRELFEETTALLERARARESAAIDEVSALRMAAAEQGIVEESFAGKPALTKLRKTWTRFSDAVMRLPATRRARGLGGVRIVANMDLMADLNLFELDAPHGRVAADMRNMLRRFLTHPARLAALSADGDAATYARTLFLAQVSTYFLRTSVWRTYEKASDEGIRDALGTVYK